MNKEILTKQSTAPTRMESSIKTFLFQFHFLLSRKGTQ